MRCSCGGVAVIHPRNRRVAECDACWSSFCTQCKSEQCDGYHCEDYGRRRGQYHDSVGGHRDYHSNRYGCDISQSSSSNRLCVICPDPHCRYVFQVDVGSTSADCDRCWFHFCIYCWKQAHGDRECKDDDDLQSGSGYGFYECEVCVDIKPLNECVEFLPCSHKFCRRCVDAYYVVKATDIIRAFECLADGCTSLADHATVKKAIGEEQFERYEKILLNNALAGLDNVVVCPRPDCGRYVQMELPGQRETICEECWLTFCVLCMRPYHGRDPCAEYTEERKRKILEEFEKTSNKAQMAERYGGMAALEKLVNSFKSDQWLSENCKKCPECKAQIEKNFGCNKMKCSKCSTLFCWLCGQRLDESNPYLHFSDPNGSCRNRLFEGAVDERRAADFDFYFELNDNDVELAYMHIEMEVLRFLHAGVQVDLEILPMF